MAPVGAATFYLALPSALAGDLNYGSNAIVLPDLGGDEPAPSKKPYDPTQTYPGAPVNTPFGSPASTSPLAGMSTQASANAPIGVMPGANPSAMMANAASVNVGDAGAGANLGATASNFHYESKDYLAHAGVDYISPKSSYGFGVKADGAALLSNTVAVGTNLMLNNNIKEAVLNGTWMPEQTNIKAKLSASYMWGQQDFGFYTGTSSASLTQASYYFSTQYVVPKEQSDYLHSVGVSTWGSRATQTNSPDPVYSVLQSATSYSLMMDPRKLSAGVLQGEALEAQAGITNQIIAKAAAGYEVLKFPFSDGTQELNNRMYQDYVVQYQPMNEVFLQAGYKIGAAMNNVMLSAAYAQWKLTGFKNNGNNGITGNQGLMLSYSFPLDGNTKSAPMGTLMRPELIGNSAYVLRDAATRPVQLPQAFLAKVDTTAVKTVATISKTGLGDGVTVNAAGQVVAAVGVGGGSIVSITRNGLPYANTSAISISAGGLMINGKALPAATSGGDTYVVRLIDTSNVPYAVTIFTAN